MQHKILKMYRTDCATMLVFLATFWALLLFTAFQVVPLAPTSSAKVIILAVVTLVAVFGSSSSIAVLVHLTKNQRQIYIEELIALNAADHHENHITHRAASGLAEVLE